MHPNVKLLTSLLPPPETPCCNWGDWDLVTSEIGSELPEDFKSLTETYGVATFCGCLWFHTPFYFAGVDAPGVEEAPSYLAMLLSRFEEMDAVAGGRECVPFPQYPESGGLLPIGATDNGDILCWITTGEPNDWGLFFWSFPGIETYTLPQTCITQMLLDLLSGESPLLPSALPPERFQKEHWRVD
ncbi:SMI1/KNR4 family protein [Blastopirellula sp. JC732]|uniref:SMI1/KNR4 family protein n=1 Tax=Blastopirellula sediminis TaxID=2894196 RepID=A0A9X1MKR2_9BACT|nr:SMI1/KNR4 family protein [Blastopirellula sediminis]MCC9609496.1 SMI1/KNR4 family protein [Blastopirellula sediminis]MCC9627727.1 SMI1/KNR4 family protein [Blastopirellula sediminis]